MKNHSLDVSIDVAAIVRWLVILLIALFVRPDLSKIPDACTPLMEAIMGD